MINDVLNDSDNYLKISAYEWIWIDYYCKGYDTPEKMGFGTDHILNYKKTDNGLVLCDDSYIEITGFETGTVADLDLLKTEDTGCINEVLNDGFEQEDILLPMATYSASAAISYSNKWCGNTNSGTSVSMNPKNYNPSYYYYSGADCCNFVSQCLKAGGMTMSGTWTATLNSSGTITEDTAYTKSGEAWRYVPTFVSYWKNKGYTATRITSSSQAIKGNPIYWLKSDGYSSNHIMLIVGTNSAGQVLINGHNNDAYKYPLTLSSKKYYTLDLVHNYKTVTSYNATTHTLKCTLCDKTMTENHVFASVASIETDYLSTGTNTCLVCGYSK